MSDEDTEVTGHSTLEDEVTMLSCNVRHLSSSDIVPYPRQTTVLDGYHH